MSIQYQDFLLEEFRSRRARNPQYSLRAFARDLGMPASKLSQNLRGLCGISVSKAKTIATKLQMPENETTLFLAMVESQHARSRVARQQAQDSLKRIREEHFSEVTFEQLSTVRDWYHMAILELTDVKGFQPDVAWIAPRLGLPVNVVDEAVHRLAALGLLEITTNGWRQTHKDLEITGGVPDRTIREHHAQILTKALVALDQVERDRREYSVQTLAIDTALLPEFKNMVREFQRQVGRLGHRGQSDSVYVMALQLFPVLENVE